MTTRHLITMLAAGVLCALVPVPGSAAEADRVWVAPHTLPNGVVVPGYWRTTAAPGYVWVEGRTHAEGRWIPGHWRPEGNPARAKVWEAGYWMDGVWHPGRWMTPRAGRTYVPAHYNNRGRFMPGHWR